MQEMPQWNSQISPLQNSSFNSNQNENIEDSKELNEQCGFRENENNDTEEIVSCEFCNKHVRPIIEKYTPFFVYIIVIILFIFISFFIIFLLPLIYLTFKHTRYICPCCNKVIPSKEKIFRVQREAKIITFQFPNFAIIVSIKYLILFLSLVVLIFFFYILRKSTSFNFDHLSKGPTIEATWLEYLEDCGNKSQFRNKFHSINNFKNKYYGNTVIWKGYFHHIREGIFNTNSLYIKMDPSENRYERPDILAFFKSSLISQVENLQKNDYFEFECTLIEISKNKEPHLCLLWNVKLIEKFKQKNLTVIELLKPLPIFEIINLQHPNPFFINLSEQNNPQKRIEIVKLGGTDFKDPSMLHSDEDHFVLNMLKDSLEHQNDSPQIKIEPIYDSRSNTIDNDKKGKNFYFEDSDKDYHMEHDDMHPEVELDVVDSHYNMFHEDDDEDELDFDLKENEDHTDHLSHIEEKELSQKRNQEIYKENPDDKRNEDPNIKDTTKENLE